MKKNSPFTNQKFCETDSFTMTLWLRHISRILALLSISRNIFPVRISCVCLTRALGSSDWRQFRVLQALQSLESYRSLGLKHGLKESPLVFKKKMCLLLQIQTKTQLSNKCFSRNPTSFVLSRKRDFSDFLKKSFQKKIIVKKSVTVYVSSS